MSNAEQASEPSMEDILSSIRKIIAEEPSASASDASAGASAGEGAEFAPKPVRNEAPDLAKLVPAGITSADAAGKPAKKPTDEKPAAETGRSPFDALVAASAKTESTAPPPSALTEVTPATAPAPAMAPSPAMTLAPATAPAPAAVSAPAGVPLPSSKPFKVAALTPAVSAVNGDDLLDMLDDTPDSIPPVGTRELPTLNNAQTTGKPLGENRIPLGAADPVESPVDGASVADKRIEPRLPKLNLPPIASSFDGNEAVKAAAPVIAPAAAIPSAFDAPKPPPSAGPLVSRLEAPEAEIDPPEKEAADSDAADSDVAEASKNLLNGSNAPQSANGKAEDVSTGASDKTSDLPPLSSLLSTLSGGATADTAPVENIESGTSAEAAEPTITAEPVASGSDDKPLDEKAADDNARDDKVRGSTVPISTDVSTLEELLGSVNTAPSVVKADAGSEATLASDMAVNGLTTTSEDATNEDDVERTDDASEGTTAAAGEADDSQIYDIVAENESSAVVAPVVAALPVIAAATGTQVIADSATVRTMEDTVSELLRPMLRDWLDANMPRIVEKALKVEMASVLPHVTTVPIDDED